MRHKNRQNQWKPTHNSKWPIKLIKYFQYIINRVIIRSRLSYCRGCSQNMKKSSWITWIVCVPTIVRNCSSLYAAALMVYRSLYTVDIDLAPPLWCYPAPSPPLWWSYPAHDSLIISIRFTFSSIYSWSCLNQCHSHGVTSSLCTLRKCLAAFAVWTVTDEAIAKLYMWRKV